MVNRINFFITSLLLAVGILLWNGYQYGHNDQVDTLPYVQYLHDKTLFANDLFMQSLTAHEPNERSAFVYLLKPFANNLEQAVFALHLFFLWLLVAGLLKITALFIRNRVVQAMVVLATLTIGYVATLGGVELYYNTFQGGNIALALCAWGIYFFLTKRYKRAALLIAAATPFQILVGLDTFLFLCTTVVLQLFTQRFTRVSNTKHEIISIDINLPQALTFAGIYAFTAGVFFVMVVLQKEQAHCGLTDAMYFDLIFNFRNAHHFLIEHFPAKKAMLFTSVVLVGIAAAIRFSKAIAHLLLTGTMMVVVYAVVTELTRFVPAASFQFYILTPWLKFFALLVIAALVAQVLPKMEVKSTTTLFVLSTITVVTITGVTTSKLCRANIPYEWGNTYKKTDSEIDVCIQAGKLTKTDALFVHPFQFSALKYFGKRSAYAEFKAGLHQRCGVQEWYGRLQEVYGINSTMPEKGFALQTIANEHLASISQQQWEALKTKGVTHAILPAKASLQLSGVKKIYTNTAYTIWEL